MQNGGIRRTGSCAAERARQNCCSEKAKKGMNPNTLKYLMGHTDIGVTLNTYTHLGLIDAEQELERMERGQDEREDRAQIAAQEVGWGIGQEEKR